MGKPMRLLVRERARGALRLGVALLLAVLGSAACGSQPTEVDGATEVIDGWIAGWNAHDPDRVAAAFTEDAVDQDIDSRRIGRDWILDHAFNRRDLIVEVRRVGEGRVTDEGTFVFRIGFDFDFGPAGGSGTDEGEIEVTVRDRLLARVEWLNR